MVEKYQSLCTANKTTNTILICSDLVRQIPDHDGRFHPEAVSFFLVRVFSHNRLIATEQGYRVTNAIT
jgi:hypothetical protein